MVGEHLEWGKGHPPSPLICLSNPRLLHGDPDHKSAYQVTSSVINLSRTIE